jgi:hypothetical protein
MAADSSFNPLVEAPEVLDDTVETGEAFGPGLLSAEHAASRMATTVTVKVPATVRAYR